MNQPNKKNIFFILFGILSVIFIVVSCLLIYLSFNAPLADERMKYGMGVIIFGMFAIIGLFLLFIYALNYARILKILGGDYWARWEYPKESGKGDVYFCHEGVHDSDKPYKALDTFGSRFLGAEIPSDDPSVIRFSCRQITGNSFSTSKRIREIPIPPGKDEDAKKVAYRFGEYLGRSSQHTKDQWRYVFPMLAVVLIWAFFAFQFVAMPAAEEKKKEEKRQLKEWAENRLKKRTEQITPLWNKIRQTIEPQMEKLRTLPDGQLTAKEAGFDENSEVQTVLYGRCQPNNDFYVSVVLKKVAVERDTTLFEGQIISGAFNYTTTRPIPIESYKKFCRPTFQENFDSKIILTDGWVYGEINVRLLLATPTPTANSQTNKVGK